MLIPEEENFNTELEKGNFYTPDTQEPEERSPWLKTILYIAGGVAALLLVLSFFL